MEFCCVPQTPCDLTRGQGLRPALAGLQIRVLCVSQPELWVGALDWEPPARRGRPGIPHATALGWGRHLCRHRQPHGID